MRCKTYCQGKALKMHRMPRCTDAATAAARACMRMHRKMHVCSLQAGRFVPFSFFCQHSSLVGLLALWAPVNGIGRTKRAGHNLAALMLASLSC